MKNLKNKNFAGEPGSRAASRYAFERGLRGAAGAALLGLAMLGASTFALAGVPGLNVSVTSLAPVDPATQTRPISYSAGGLTYQTAYTVRMTASSPVNTVYFYALSKVENGLSAPFGVVGGLRPGDSCLPVAAAGATQLECAIGAIQPGATISFTLLVPSPVPPGDGASSVLSVSWAVQAGQGQPNPSSLVHEGSQDVTLRVGSAADGVQSYVQPGQALAVASAGSTTGVTTPEAVTVGVKQIALFTSCSSHYVECLESTVRIVDETGSPIPFNAASPLLIDLVRAASSLKKNARIENATLFYTEVRPDGSSGATQQIQECIDGPAWQIPSGQSRCVVPAVRKATTLTFKDAAGNWHFRIIALSNGKIAW